jgi:Tol biopolymer transport system component
MRFKGSTLLLTIFSLFLFACIGDGTTHQDTISLVSVDPNGVEGNADSNYAIINSDGRHIAFASSASNLVEGDTNGVRDIFLRDMDLGITYRVSVSTAGTEANGSSNHPAISSDGRYVAFDSDATNLVSDDTNNKTDVFVRDMESGIISRTSASTAGTQGYGFSVFPAISPNGRYVAFESDAFNLVPDDNNNEWDVFVHDMDQGITSRVSVSTAGTESDNGSFYPATSSIGRYVTFSSWAGTSLAPGDNHFSSNIYLRDMDEGITSRVSISTAGTQTNGNSYKPDISTDGRLICFHSGANNLVSGDTNSKFDIFLRDTALEITSRISVSTAGTQSNGRSFDAVISADGRYIAFDSEATNLVSDDTNGTMDVFLHEVAQGITSRISVNTAGIEGNGTSYKPSISSDGLYLTFQSVATNLLDGEITSGVEHVYRVPRP